MQETPEITPELEALGDMIASFVMYPEDEHELEEKDALQRVTDLHHIMAEWAKGAVFISEKNVRLLDDRLRGAALRLRSFQTKEVDLEETLEQVKGTLEWL